MPNRRASANARSTLREPPLVDSPSAMSPARPDAASGRAVTWLKRALESNAADSPINSNADRDEAFEAYRALRGGGYTLIALYLRHGDPRGVLTAADHADLGRIIAPELRDRLERAADGGDADAPVRRSQRQPATHPRAVSSNRIERRAQRFLRQQRHH